MRTDSVNFSDTALNGAKAEIISAYGESYSNPTKYKTKNAGAQEAHEAIRPTDFAAHSISGESDEVKLYDLISSYLKRPFLPLSCQVILDQINLLFHYLPFVFFLF